MARALKAASWRFYVEILGRGSQRREEGDMKVGGIHDIWGKSLLNICYRGISKL